MPILRIAALLAVVVLGAIIISAFTTSLENSIQLSGLTPVQQQQILIQADKIGGIVIPDTFNETARLFTRNTIEESFTYSFRLAMMASAVLALAGALVSFFTIHPPQKGNPRIIQ